MFKCAQGGESLETRLVECTTAMTTWYTTAFLQSVKKGTVWGVFTWRGKDRLLFQILSTVHSQQVAVSHERGRLGVL